MSCRSITQIIRQAGAGILIELDENGDLRLRAPNEPPQAMVQHLREHKRGAPSLVMTITVPGSIAVEPSIRKVSARSCPPTNLTSPVTSTSPLKKPAGPLPRLSPKIPAPVPLGFKAIPATAAKVLEFVSPCTKISPPNATNLAPLFTDFTSANLGLPKNLALPFYCESTPDQFRFVANPAGLKYIDEGVGGFLSGSLNPNKDWAKLGAAAAASAARPPPSQWVDDMVAGLKSGLGQKIAQIPGRLQAAVVKKAPMRQQPRTPQVTAAGIASEILARSSGIEDRDVPTGLQGLPVDKSDGSGRRPCPECRWVRGSTALPNRSSPPRIADHPQFNMTASPPRYCRMNQTRAASVMRPSS